MTKPIETNELAPASAASGTASPDTVAAALAATEQGIVTLERMQQQMAELHRQYLEGQLAAQRCVQQLIEQQNVLISGAAGVPAAFSQPASAGPLPVSWGLADSTPATRATRRADAAEVVRPPHFEAPRSTTARDDGYGQVLLEVIADKTGYPVETLELSMRLDADLGIDSIKRVEILSALQERLPDAPAVQSDDLGALQTLGDIVRFLVASPIGGGEATGQTKPRPSQTQGVPPTVTQGVPTAGFAAVLLEVVAEKTGYPVETLELSMRLDADLGIDSIKRVEILSTLQERLPEAPAVQSDDLGALQTLGDIVEFFEGRAGVDASPPAAATEGVSAGRPETRPSQTQDVPPVRPEPGPSQTQGVPPSVGERMRLPQAADAVGEGVGLQQLDCQWVGLARILDTPGRTRLELAHARLYIVDDGAGLAAALLAALGKRGVAAQAIGLDGDPGRLKTSGLVVVAPPEPAADFSWRALALVQRFAAVLRHSAESADVVLAGVSRLGGDFGLTGRDPIEPRSGSLAGLVKTAACEWPDVQAKAIDVPMSGDEMGLAEAIADELLLAGPVEVGITADGPSRIELTPWTPSGSDKPSVKPGDVVVISGGGRGIAAEVAIALAEAWQPTLVLLGRTPEPAQEPDWLTGLREEAQIKRAIVEQEGGRLTPKAVEFAYRRIVAQREIGATLGRIDRSGGRGLYRAIDVRDADAIECVLAEIRANHGPIRGVVHAAGVLADRLIEDKTVEQFDEVFGIKVVGLTAMLNATVKDDLRILALFSSSTARFGRKGQVDYAMANEVLNKMAQVESRRRPACRVVSFNWGPWDGGMVTPQLARIFASEGVGLIDLGEGAEYVVQELSSAPGGPVEIVVIGKTERAAGSVAPSSAPPVDRRDKSGGSQISTGGSQAFAAPVLAFRRQVDVDSMPILRSHVINGRAVVPMALIIEWLAHGAMHDNPGLVFAGFDDLRIFKGVILDPEATLAIDVWAGPASTDGDEEVVGVELRSGTTLHARAQVRLAARYHSTSCGRAPVGLRPYPQMPADIYLAERLFHGTDLQGVEAVEGCGESGIIGRAKAAPHPAVWIDNPLRSAWLADPLALDCAFQLAILWCQERRGAGSLPTSVASYRQFRRAFPSSGTKIVLRLTRVSDHAATADIEFLDGAGELVARMEGYECVIDPSLSDAFARNQLVLQGR